jgi:nucleoside-diphosphate-sugar epimerase
MQTASGKGEKMVAMKSAALFSLLLFLSSSPRKGGAYDVLIIGGTRFSGAHLWRELHGRGHSVSVYHRGRTPAARVPSGETDAEFGARIGAATFLVGDRKDPSDLKRLIDPSRYDYVYDMNAREESDTRPLAELFVGALHAFSGET